MPTSDSDCLLVIDAQEWILNLAESSPLRSTLIAAIADAVSAARSTEKEVLWVQYRTLDDSDGGPHGAARILPECGFVATDPIVTKYGIDAFEGTTLAEELLSRRIDRIELAGFSTAHAVLATAATAKQLGFSVIVNGNACGAPSLAEHEHALRQLTERGVTIR